MEHLMRTLNKVLRIGVAGCHNVDSAVYVFLRDYRFTPHGTTGETPSSLCMNRKVQDTIPYVPESSDLHEQVWKALSKRVEKNDKMQKKRRAKKQNIRIGDHVLVRNRKSGSKFLLQFEKDPWVAFCMASGGMETDQIFPQTSLVDDGDEGSVDFWDRRFLLPSPGMVVDESLRAGRGCAGMQGSEVIQSSNQDPLAVGSLPPRQGLERYHLRPRPPRSTRLKGFVAD
ncbi:hypothetical protein NDU88_002139 [Pleurodeles waltl]|uniref:Uncharacterized protein n=1 Tax=Pleurodeles waltl TaxID=8319 RepID=A0AAV7NGS9_PLEWA|nr:hypothetical protein NDU88_002139 [Pleurodeles waltl]